MARVKICGINTPAAMDGAVAAGADWVGFVFHPRSPRAVTPAVAEALSARHGSAAPRRVGLFVEPTETQIEDALDALPLDVLQLYANAARAAELRAIFGITVWRAIGIGGAADLPAAGDPPESIDGYVLDAKPAPRATNPGGNAAAFDWSVLGGWRSPLPWLLAGGLTAGNVASAIAATGASAVDVSSGVETGPGVKDAGLMMAFMRAAQPG